ncbi:MAG: sigma-70 family RNA polymerase sigma factor [Planctomycetota bacterium]|nr:MAG: sigma-70 family RNA polymerase sigma factor [Planctomycetota bacterium]REK24590.1 MAG: sigma-70 family RNA polymerase sigma factor [Planctomycetota bacterium]REK45976.1 MAG: sigma-70 family RNA polymerase sigma factor [Planctomycetota bacterium]
MLAVEPKPATDDLIDGCVVNEPFAAAMMAEMPASRWSAWFMGCVGLNSCRTMEKSTEAIYDELLVLKCQDGDDAALEELVERWQSRLFRHAMQLTARRDVANDVVQEGWIAIVRGLSRLRDPASFPKWAYRIVGNKCADWTRRQQRQRRLTENVADATDPAGLGGDDPAAVLTADDELGRLRQAMRQMRSDQRAILSMCYLDGMSLREIAHALDIPTGTVKSRLYHAREQLKRVLERIET